MSYTPMPPLGSAASAASLPVVVASDQAAIAVKGASTPTDSFANPTTAIPVQNFLMGWNDNTSTWDRIIAEGVSTDGDNPPVRGALSTEAYMMAFNGTTYDRVRSSITNGLQVDVTRTNPADPDNPGSVRVVGNPDGDYKGLDLIEQVMDPSTGIQMQVAAQQAGNWTVNVNPHAVTGNFYQPIQPVSLASAPSTPITSTDLRTVVELLTLMLAEQKTTNVLLAAGLNVNVEPEALASDFLNISTLN